MSKQKESRLKKIRNKLYKQNPFCPDCSVKMILPEEVGFITLKNGNRRLKSQPKNLCTIEHKYTRLDPRRRERNCNSELRWSLLCAKCNNNKGRVDHDRRLKIEDKWRISGKYPKKYKFFKILLDRIKRIKYICITIKEKLS